MPRVSYFPLVMEKVTKHFSRFVSDAKKNSQDTWLEFEGSPLKLNYPIGLLWDLNSASAELPWNITINFSNFPEGEIVRCNNRAAMEMIFMSSLKEADTLKHRGEVMNGLQKKDHNQLWLGLQNVKFDQFWSVNRKLMENTHEKPFRSIPLRIYQPEKNHYTQRLVKPKGTLGEVLASLGFIPSLETESQSIITHGIQPPLETPIQWLSEHLSFPDNFLHLVLTISKS